MFFACDERRSLVIVTFILFILLSVAVHFSAMHNSMTQQFHSSVAIANCNCCLQTFLLVIWQARSRLFINRTNVAGCIPKVHTSYPPQQTIDSHCSTASLQRTTRKWTCYCNLFYSNVVCKITAVLLLKISKSCFQKLFMPLRFSPFVLICTSKFWNHKPLDTRVLACSRVLLPCFSCSAWMPNLPYQEHTHVFFMKQ